ncbi:MAG TPA: hypothetical protein ENH82_15980, partial [bacterium]|nr:hypothetical protein [bacterium]
MKFDYKNFELLLDTLLENHTSVTFPERFSLNIPRFIMRHDIDVGLECLGEIPNFEYESGVKATYFIQVASAFYNPFCPSQACEIEKLLKMGHRLGLHFDNQKDEREISEQEISEQIEQEIAIFQRYYSTVDAVSFHQP